MKPQLFEVGDYEFREGDWDVSVNDLIDLRRFHMILV